MFAIGDKVVYPMHGAGVIEAVEEREVLGEKRLYYVLRLSLGDMRILVPSGQIAEIGLRQVIDAIEADQVMSVLQSRKSVMSNNWHRRYRANLDKMKTGDVYAVAEVVRNLIRRNQEKGLSTGERRMLENAKQILVSELVLAYDTPPEQIEAMLSRLLA
ncbi:transcriptional regulator, card family, putative [Heliomicrobium modesticaldum Ice1]|uniref:Transcriptional regulator, card family, putative n=1 Tax=Heliobacterium modesticaldum (strain ATCC 51547 / Ice1) TaxID=498761 RepID=B0TBU0_HELMI|nr:CarD family transcriptional regulator [Heliomicrobium modesticaldum]ABZ83929.1 transcriptional regulator, card family, putative [Heliomicrobium modesticaldum Ice1]